MSDVTQILIAIENGDCRAAEQLPPLVYDELRRLAAEKMTHEQPDHTLQATALVHEAYIRLVDVTTIQRWDSQRHFFAAAAEAMRRILVEHARHKSRLKRGGDLQRQELDESQLGVAGFQDDVLQLDAALAELERKDARRAEVVKLRYFAGLTTDEVATALNVSSSTVDRDWTYARAWLFRRVAERG